MRTTAHHRTSRIDSKIPWNWIIIIITGLGILFLSSLLSGNNNDGKTANAITVAIQSGSEAFIKPENGSAKQITGDEYLYTTDSSLSVSSGLAHIFSQFIDGYLDKSSEMSYREHTANGEKIEFTRGRIWIESHGNNLLQMKNLEATIKDGDIVMAEQPNQIFSTLYVLKGNISITADGRNYTLTTGKKIMISKSDLSNPSTTLDMLSGPIDDSLKQNPLFILRNGSSLLESSQNTTITGSLISTGSLSGGIISSPTSKYIELTTPTDESIITSQTIDISGKILSKDVKRVTINDIDAVVSMVDETFILKGAPITSDIMNIIYKAYSKESTILDRGVITIYAKNRQSGTEKLTPTNFPVNDKDFRITNPTENPFKTTESSITVSGVVPKDTVQYIMVNNYRLKKFVANSSTWYYYANTDYDTMKEGINLYEIDFYGSNNELLHKQLFTIVKEARKSVSGELIQ